MEPVAEGDFIAVYRHKLLKMSEKLGVDIFQSLPFTYEEGSRRFWGSDMFSWVCGALRSVQEEGTCCKDHVFFVPAPVEHHRKEIFPISFEATDSVIALSHTAPPESFRKMSEFGNMSWKQLMLKLPFLYSERLQLKHKTHHFPSAFSTGNIKTFPNLTPTVKLTIYSCQVFSSSLIRPKSSSLSLVNYQGH